MTIATTTAAALARLTCPRCGEDDLYADGPASFSPLDNECVRTAETSWANDTYVACGGYDCDWDGTVWHLIGGEPLSDLAARVASAESAVSRAQDARDIGSGTQRTLDFARVAAHLARDAYQAEAARLAGLGAQRADHLASGG